AGLDQGGRRRAGTAGHPGQLRSPGRGRYPHDGRRRYRSGRTVAAVAQDRHHRRHRGDGAVPHLRGIGVLHRSSVRSRRRTMRRTGVLMSRLTGKAAVVTGAAQGIGLAAVEAVIGGGAAVTVFDINADGARAAAERLGPAALPVAGDVAGEEDVARMVAATAERFGRLDILVNNAAAFGPEI